MNCYVLTINDPEIVRKSFSYLSSSFDLRILLNRNPIQYNHSFINMRNKRILSKAEFNCSFGHLKIAHEAARFTSCNEWCLVLEDDAVVDLVNLKHLLDDLKDICFDYPTAIVLGHSKTVPSNLIVQYLKQPMFVKSNLASGHKLGLIRSNYYGTVGYLVNHGYLKLMCNFKSPFWCADDWSFLQSLGIQVLNTRPPIVWEDLNTPSSINNPLLPHHMFSRNNFLKECKAILKSQLLRFW